MSSLSSAIELANILQRCFALYQTKSTNDQDPYVENKNQVLLKLITKWMQQMCNVMGYGLWCRMVDLFCQDGQRDLLQFSIVC